MNQALFRKEALAARHDRLAGEVVLSRPLHWTLLVAFLAGLTLLVLCFLAFNRYARKVRVEGLLLPEQGIVEVPAPQGGQLQQLFVRQGDEVRAGQPLFVLRLDHTAGSGEGLSERLLESLQAQRQRLDEQLALQEQAREQEEVGAAGELQLIAASLTRLEGVLATEGALLRVRDAARLRARQLEVQGLLSRADLEAVEAAWLQQRRAREEVVLQQLQWQSRRHEVEQARQQQRLQHRRQLASLAAEREALQQRILQAGAERETLVRAPLDATVGHLALGEGMSLAAGTAVLSLLPQGVLLEAELQVPSSAVGFLAAGQAVQLRYDSFPYQKFGVQEGRVRELSRSARLQGELPLYRARVALAAQEVPAYGEVLPLRAGMTLSADIVVDERSLLEWLLEPLYSLRGAP